MVMKRARVIAFGAATLAVAAGVPALAATSTPSSLLGGVVPSWVSTSHIVSALDQTQLIKLNVVLNYRDAAGLKAFDADVSNPASPNFRKFLTTAEFNARFSPTAASIKSVDSWLSSKGLKVDGSTSSGVVVTADGSIATIEKALGTTLANLDLNGKTVRAPLKAAKIPAKLAGIIAGITGLDNVKYQPLSAPAAPVPAAFLNARPCSTYWGETVAPGQPKFKGQQLDENTCGYTPAQLRGAYGLDKVKETGAGATVGIIDAYASSTMATDLATYSAKHGLPAIKPGQFTQLFPQPLIQNTPELATNAVYAQLETTEYNLLGMLPNLPIGAIGLPSFDPEGWSGEEALDVEGVHTMAPGANIVYIPSISDNNDVIDLALLEAVETSKVQVISNSYGSAGEDVALDDKTLFDAGTAQAAAKGITVAFSAGDSGDEVADLGSRQADYPADSDMVTALGGTSLFIGKTNNYLGEGYWGTEKYVRKGSGWDLKNPVYNGSGGGGVSVEYAEPSYQKGVVPNSLATFGGVKAGRVLPDVSLVGDPTTGYLVGQTQATANGQVGYSEYRIGGTSVSCPLFSAMVADAIQGDGGTGLGLINPVLYAGAKSGAFRDITAPKASVSAIRFDYADPADPTTKVTGTVRNLGNLSTLHLLKGYDDSTGLGSPIAGPFIKLLDK